jgi:hypothetical protein
VPNGAVPGELLFASPMGFLAQTASTIYVLARKSGRFIAAANKKEIWWNK